MDQEYGLASGQLPQLSDLKITPDANIRNSNP